MLHQLPAVITHTYHPARGAFRNLCSLPEENAERIISAIRNEGFSRLKADYLQRRLRTEAWLIAERTRKLGITPLARPIYFFLGNMSDGWDRSRPASIVLPLSNLDPSTLTFTYPDSMTSCPQPRGAGHTPCPHHEQLFTLPEITDIIARHAFPDPSLPREQRGPDSFIEVQLWDDASLNRYRP